MNDELKDQLQEFVNMCEAAHTSAWELVDAAPTKATREWAVSIMRNITNLAVHAMEEKNNV